MLWETVKNTKNVKEYTSSFLQKGELYRCKYGGATINAGDILMYLGYADSEFQYYFLRQNNIVAIKFFYCMIRLRDNSAGYLK